MYPQRPQRLPHFSYRGTWRYSLTFCTYRKQEAFVDPLIVNALIELLRRSAQDAQFEVLTCCFMRDHLHLLLQGASRQSYLISCCRLIRQRLACEYKQRTGNRLWQPGYYERVLREEEPTEVVATYILGNPVKEGLAKTFLDYPFSGGTWYDALASTS